MSGAAHISHRELKQQRADDERIALIEKNKLNDTYLVVGPLQNL